MTTNAYARLRITDAYAWLRIAINNVSTLHVL
jgi:hypothetical protein